MTWLHRVWRWLDAAADHKPRVHSHYCANADHHWECRRLVCTKHPAESCEAHPVEQRGPRLRRKARRRRRARVTS